AARGDLLPPAIAALGTALLAVSPLAGGTPLMLDYFPLLTGNRLFAAGFGLICLALTMAALRCLAAPAESRARPRPEALRLSAWAVLMAFLATLLSAARGAAPAELAWAGGHALLFAHVIMLGHEWTVHGDGAAACSRTPLRLLAAGSTLMPLIPLSAAPGSAAVLTAYTQSMSLLLAPPLLWLAWRLHGDPARRPSARGRLVLRLSLPLFALGCLLGALIAAPTTLITAHYHATMGAVAISRMAMAYRQRDQRDRGASRQLLCYTAGLALLAGGLALAAIEGAPRKTAASELIVHGPWFVAGMSISGLGGLVAMLGTGWWVRRVLGAPAGAAGLSTPPEAWR
ncbi:MAG TPA: hypothetical protein VFH22_12165, partial [Rhodocyclaceae bacterium]|nr:hypothetical protein [Rhodocyclaceae bacterium]